MDREARLPHFPLVRRAFFALDGRRRRHLRHEPRADGSPREGNHGAGAGRLFIWRQTLLPGWKRGETAEHVFELDPIPSPDGAGEFHVGAVCTASILPTAGSEPPAAGAIDIETVDHGRGN